MKANASYLRFIPWGISLFLFILCGFLAFRIFDQAVTLDYGQSGVQLLLEQRDVLQQVAKVTAEGMSRAKFLELLQHQHIEHFAKDEEGDRMIVAGQVVFHFKNDKLVRIES